jgi:hypothetical protein
MDGLRGSILYTTPAVFLSSWTRVGTLALIGPGVIISAQNLVVLLYKKIRLIVRQTLKLTCLWSTLKNKNKILS